MSFPSAPALFDLTGRTFLVVGGARHLGRDMAMALAEFGADGVVTSQQRESAVRAGAEIGAATGRKIQGLQLDATNELDVRSAVDVIRQSFSRVDILINAVGGGGGGSGVQAPELESRPLEEWETVQRTNVTAPFLICKHVVPLMIAQGSGSIINLASVAGLVGRDRRVYPNGMTPQSIDYGAA